MMIWEIMNRNRNPKSMRDVEIAVGFIKNRENGIIEQAIAQSSLSELLQPYGRQADFFLTFNLGYRSVLDIYLNQDEILTDDIVTSLSIALDSESYNLTTLLQTLELEYNPLDTISIKENIVTSSTYNANQIYDKVSTSKNISEIVTTADDTIQNGKQSEKHTENITDNKGLYTETGSETHNLGKIETSEQGTTGIGQQENSKTDTLTHAPYNSNNYSPKDKTTTSETLGARNDVSNKTSQTNPVTNSISSSNNISAHTDTIDRSTNITKDSVTDTRNNTTTQKPYSEDTETLSRNDKEDRNNNENKNRTLSGWQGIAPQDLIAKQRELANLSIIEYICKIVINTIANGFINAY